jgi:negative regulator of sigma E activity
MTDGLDPETLAALLDGRLHGPELERALARLAASDETRAALAEAAAIRSALGRRTPGPPGWSVGRRVALALAAAMGAIAVLPV